ncbi:hypothetical protein ID866_6813 [Astraeus odoratus]|nr:hypothetical protein ID866_6813 [Astraeus odoratus]
MSNALTRQAGLQLGPVVLETLVHHYFDRIKKENKKNGKAVTKLRQDELLYDQAFNIVKVHLAGIRGGHSVEEVQAFANNRTPTPPWVHTVRLLVPVSYCDDAAKYLIEALGGEEHAKRMVGGTKWWQVRGIPGYYSHLHVTTTAHMSGPRIDAEWIAAKKDLQEVKRRRKASQSRTNEAAAGSVPKVDPTTDTQPSSSQSSNQDMDELRCILYVHGGGYFFGSIDQERYCMQRHARKIGGRVFAINYRLAPQYPFPCGLHDLLAAYLYLIRPPEGSHQPIDPAHIVVAGDSAGGGLTLALLQVLRDVGLPLPAGAVLISPWCDLTHSFPSIHTNTETDVMPPFGLSLQRPSPLWPPPSAKVSRKVRTRLRRRIREMIRIHGRDDRSTSSVDPARHLTTRTSLGDHDESVPMPVHVGTTVALPSVDDKDDRVIRLRSQSGELLIVEDQIHLYTENSLLSHPLVSPVLSYLGGLPPLLVIASDKEVLRDEIIYCAHKAAEPSQFPLTDGARAMYPALDGIEKRYGRTPVHLQVYDGTYTLLFFRSRSYLGPDTAHVIPVLFGFTTPGKFCYRSIANFIRHVTGITTPMQPSFPALVTSPSHIVSDSPRNEEPGLVTCQVDLSGEVSSDDRLRHLAENQDGSSTTPNPSKHFWTPSHSRSSLTRSGFFRMNLMPSLLKAPAPHREIHSPPGTSTPETPASDGSSRRHSTVAPGTGVRFAGEAIVYLDNEGRSWKELMIRERVSTRGEIRPLEPNDQLVAFSVPSHMIGVISELCVRRYLQGKATFDKKFAKEREWVEKRRRRNNALAKESSKVILGIRELRDDKPSGKSHLRDGLDPSSGHHGWAWALDEDERPPPSSIVSRSDTDEARRLARIADQAVLQDDVHVSGNSLWAIIVNMLSVGPEKDHPVSDSEGAEHRAKEPVLRKSKSVFAALRAGAKTSAPEKPAETV